MVLYSFEDLQKRNSDGLSVFDYLKILFDKEFSNFLERVSENNLEFELEARLWCSLRGQTLIRTVDGMMLYRKALGLLLELEHQSEPQALYHDQPETHWPINKSALILQKYNYVSAF